MFRFVYISSVCLLISVFGYAQNTPVIYPRPARIIAKLAPLWLLDADPAVTGALEIQTGRRTSVQGEVGYGWPGWGQMSAADRHAGTWRVKTELRVYRNRYRTNRRENINIATTYPLGNYWAFEAYTKLLTVSHTWNPVYAVVGPGPPAVPAEMKQTLIRRNSVTLTAKVGRQFGWTDRAHQGTARVLWDVYAGIGIRLTNQDNDGEWNTTGYTESFRGMFNRFSNNGVTVLPAFSAGIKLGFAL